MAGKQKFDKSYEEYLERFAANLKRVRNERGLTQEDMAELGFNYRYYQKLESGRYSPSLRTVFTLSAMLKVELADLLSIK